MFWKMGKELRYGREWTGMLKSLWMLNMAVHTGTGVLGKNNKVLRPLGVFKNT
jgi:hypothetical protein